MFSKLPARLDSGQITALEKNALNQTDICSHCHSQPSVHTQNFHRGKAIQPRTRALWHPIPLRSSLTEESAAKLDHSKKINFWMSKTTYNYMDNITNWRIFLKMLKNMLRNGKLI